MQNTRKRSVESPAQAIEIPRLGGWPDSAGFHHYNEDCAGCHTPRGEKPSEGAQGMNPRPLDLAEEAEEPPTAEIFWIVNMGLR
jgi:mono/diheme cytochrome c family protein